MNVMRKINLVLLLPFIFLFSCGGEEEAAEVISLEEFAGETGVPDFDSTNTASDTSAIELHSNIDFLVNSLRSKYDTTIIEKPHLMDRFGYSSVQKIQFIGKEKVAYGKSNMVVPKAEFYYYTFSDTSTTKNAFYNWMDCFGSDCYPLVLNEDVDAIKMPPLSTWVYDTTVVIAKYLCEHEENDWKSFEDSIESKFGKSYKYSIKVNCGGPLKWK